MVLGRQHGQHRRAVGDGEERELLALHELLHQHLAPRRAETVVLEHRVDGGVGVGDRLAHDHSLTRREPRRLDHHRRAEVARGALRRRRVDAANRARGRHSRLAHERLRERLRRLDARRAARGPEHRDAGGAQRVREPCRERRLGTDHDELRLLLHRQCDDPRNVVRAHRHAAAERRQPRISGRGDDLDRWLVLRQLPGERVLAPAASDDQNPHASVMREGRLRSSRHRPSDRETRN